MIDKIKQILTVLASATALLYGTGYIAEYAHARMLGISLVEPDNVYYLISGGTVFFKTLIALYDSLDGAWVFYFIVLGIGTAMFLHFEKKWGTNTMNRLPKTYGIALVLIVSFLIIYAIPIFTASMDITNLLPNPPGIKQNNKIGSNSGETLVDSINRKIRRWIQNEGKDAINKQKLTNYYVGSVFTVIFSGIVLFSALRRRRYWKPLPIPLTNKEDNFSKRVLTLSKRAGQPIFVFTVIILFILVAVQVLVIPFNYGILVQSNYFPQIELTMAEGKEKLLPENQMMMWLIRESDGQLLIFALYSIEINNKKRQFRTMFSVVRKAVEKIEIVDISFIFKYIK